MTELMPLPTEAAGDLAHIQRSAQIPAASPVRGFKTLQQSAQDLVAEGVTTQAEVRRLDLIGTATSGLS